MTGFGSTSVTLGGYHHRIEVKTVNSKFIDTKVRVPPDYQGLDIRIQKFVKERLSRGHVEVGVMRDFADADTPKTVVVNWDLADSYYKAFQSIKAKYGINQDASLAMVTNAREVITIQRGQTDIDKLWKSLEPVMGEVLESVIEMRESEGKSLAVDLAGRCNTIKEITNKIGKIAPGVVESYQKKLEEKIAQIQPQELDNSRLVQEVCYFADRCDVTEELIRLKSHTQQFLHFLDSDEPVGRKLDFLVQEMNREANTIGSKSTSAEIALLVVDLKSELEKVREQIQNVE